MKKQIKKQNQTEQLKNGKRVHADNLPEEYIYRLQYEIETMNFETTSLNYHAKERQEERSVSDEDIKDVLLYGALIEVHTRNNTRTILKSMQVDEDSRVTVAFDLKTKTVTTVYVNDLEQVHRQNKGKYITEQLIRTKQIDRLLLGDSPFKPLD